MQTKLPFTCLSLTVLFFSLYQTVGIEKLFEAKQAGLWCIMLVCYAYSRVKNILVKLPIATKLYENFNLWANAQTSVTNKHDQKELFWSILWLLAHRSFFIWTKTANKLSFLQFVCSMTSYSSVWIVKTSEFVTMLLGFVIPYFQVVSRNILHFDFLAISDSTFEFYQ